MVSIEEIDRVLQGFNNPDDRTRKQAEMRASELEERSTGEFYQMLAEYAANEEFKIQPRQQACLYLKNALNLDMEDESIAAMHESRWLGLYEGVRQEVKDRLIFVLTTAPLQVRTGAGQALGKIACIERAWHEYPEGLLGMAREAGEAGNKDGMRAAVRAIGILCEDLMEGELNDEEVNGFLEIVIPNVDGDGGVDPDVRLDCVSALKPLLTFARGSFEDPTRGGERSMIVDAVIKAARDDTVAQVQVGAFSCIATIGQLYFENLGDSLRSLMELTEAAASAGAASVSKGEAEFDLIVIACLAVEFWIVIAEKELEMQHERMSVAVKEMAPNLVPLFMECIQARDPEEDADEDEEQATLTVMGASALRSVLKLDGLRSISHLADDFLTAERFSDEDWRIRESTIMAMSLALEALAEVSDADGVAAKRMAKQICDNFMEELLVRCDENAERFDPNPQARDTNTFVIAIVIRFFFDCIPEALHDDLFRILIDRLQDHPRVARQSCFALLCLARVTAGEAEDEANALTGSLNDLLKVLVDTYDRDDAGVFGLRNAAFEAMNELLAAAAVGAPEPRELLVEFLNFIFERLNDAINAEVSTEGEAAAKDAAMAHSCAMVGTLISRLGEHCPPAAMSDGETLVRRTFEMKDMPISKEDSVTALQRIVDAAGEDAKHLLGDWKHHLIDMLKEPAAADLFGRGLGLCSDFAMALGEEFRVLENDCIPLILDTLSAPDVRHDLKPSCISTLGDIAFALGGTGFHEHVGEVCSVLGEAAKMCSAEPSDHEVEIFQSLREALISAYQSILEAFNDEEAVRFAVKINPYVAGIVDFVQSLWLEFVNSGQTKGDPNHIVLCASILGDLSCVIHHDVLHPHVNIELDWVKDLLDTADRLQRENEDIPRGEETHGQWTRRLLTTSAESRDPTSGGGGGGGGFGSKFSSGGTGRFGGKRFG